jgi:WD40 repeat protein
VNWFDLLKLERSKTRGAVPKRSASRFCRFHRTAALRVFALEYRQSFASFAFGCVFIAVVFASTRASAGTPVTALAFTPNGAALISNGAHRIEIRSSEDGSLQRQFACNLSKVTSASFHPSGELLAVAGGDPGVRGEVLLFRWPEPELLQRFTNYADLATCVGFDSAGALFGVASADHTACVYKFRQSSKADQTFTLTGHAGPVLGIAFSPTGATVVTCSADRSIKVWSTDDGRLLRTFTHHTEAVHVVAFRPTKTKDALPVFCASAGEDRTVRIWQPEIGRMVRIVRQHQAPIFALAFSSDGASLFSAGKEGIVRRIDANSDTVLEQWPEQKDWIYAIAISPDGSKLATGDWSGAVRIRSLENSKAAPVVK